jgi:hypothetical protein
MNVHGLQLASLATALASPRRAAASTGLSTAFADELVAFVSRYASRDASEPKALRQ